MYDILNIILGIVCSEVTRMLNEERVKHMVKLASYESKEGTEDLKVSAYFKKDYVGMNMLFTFLWVTFGYAILVGILAITYMDFILEGLTIFKAIVLLGSLVLVYIVLVVAYCVFAKVHYKKIHFKARQHVKTYKKELEKLSQMYEKEEV